MDSDDDEPPVLVDVAMTSLEPPTLVPSPFEDVDTDAAMAENNADKVMPMDTIAEAPEATSTSSAIEGSTLQQQQQQQQQQPQPPIPDNLPPCPVTILSGFLGSGKTTLIQYILKSPDHGKRIAVIENEFGEGLAVETLIARDGVSSDSLQDFIELPNGCICCTVKDSLVATLERLVEQKTDLDYILIEASGMANPGPIASVFWLDDALESRLQLDGIVTLVDAPHILDQLASTEEASQQVAYADRLLINKIDQLKDPLDVDPIVAALRKLHPTAPVLTTTYSRVPNLEWILNANCFGGSTRLEELDTYFQQQERVEKQANANGGHDHSHSHSHHDHGGHDHSHDHAHGEDGKDCSICQEAAGHRHTESISTIAFSIPGSVSLKKLNAWLAHILWPHQDESNQLLTAVLKDPSQKRHLAPNVADQPHAQLFRVKGIVSVIHEEDDLMLMDDQEHYMEDVVQSSSAAAGTSLQQQQQPRYLLDRRRHIVQAVHDLWEVHPASDNLLFTPDEPREGKLVLIGKHLNKPELEQGFRACFW
eukprot:Nitzschia sp. Nitz4//scaffold22_size323478//20280//21890//NITZ4_000494-RA/size323478-processed-gene-0.437-mRNA-1//-1//CDS//3329542896//2388//frame0